MHRSHLLALAAVAVLLAAAPAFAAPGVHLSWDHCSADGQVANRSFACDTNAGSEALIVSFESPVQRSDRTGIEVYMNLTSASAALPDWWTFYGSFGAILCRTNVLSSVATGDPASACVDPYGGAAFSGIAAYQVGAFGPNTVRLWVVVAVPQDSPFAVGPGIEDFAVRLNINHVKTTGSDGCSGCFVPVCIGVGRIHVVAPPTLGTNIDLLAGPNAGGGPATVTWQGAYVHDYTVAFERPDFFSYSLACAAGAPVATRRTTWGSVKSLYR